jgi:hypothetical protein
LKILVLAALENILSVVSVIWFLPSITTRSGVLSTPSDECLALNIQDIRMVGQDIKITATLK